MRGRGPRLPPQYTRRHSDEDGRKVTAVSNITKLTDATFDETISGSEQPVLVDFWAEWCGPCKMIAPVLEELAHENGTKLRIAKLNVDENPNTAMRYNVMSIPTLLVFKPGETGQEARRLVGAKGKAQLLQELAEFVA
ncbi:MAG TPA: thioredoxin [Acidimicrobiia bacterium]|nr:thioredoxin [Acidimicrobiia bacterium]